VDFSYSVVINRHDSHLNANEPSCQSSNTMMVSSSLVYHHFLNYYYIGKASRRFPLSKFTDNTRSIGLTLQSGFTIYVPSTTHVLAPGARPSIAHPSTIVSDHRSLIVPLLPTSHIKIQACQFLNMVTARIVCISAQFTVQQIHSELTSICTVLLSSISDS
jgi:hypothetical protein